MSRPLFLAIAVLAAGCADAPTPDATVASSPDGEGAGQPIPAASETYNGTFIFFAQAAAGPESESTEEGAREFTLPPGVRAVRFTLEWRPSTPASETVELALAQDGHPIVGKTTGRSPLTLQLTNATELTGGRMHILVRSPSAGAMAAQEFNWTATVDLAD